MGAVSGAHPVRSGRLTGRVSEGSVLLVASFGAFLAFLDATIVNVAFPSIRSSFPTVTVSDLSWVLNAYNIVFAAALVPAGRLADLVGRRRAFGTGVLVFTAGSAACAAAGSIQVLVAMRCVQALGAAILVPASLAIVVTAFSGERRTHAVGLWGATAAVAAGLGPPIGGLLVQAGGWRWAFLVNVPFGIVAYLSSRMMLGESRAPGRRRLPDLRGAVLLAGALALLTLAIVEGSTWGWASLATAASFAGSALLSAGFVLSSQRHRSPLLDPELLRIRAFSVANVVTLVAGMGFYAYLLDNILFLRYLWGYSILVAGLSLVPGALVAAVVAAMLGPVAQRHGYRLVAVPGAVVWACAYVWYFERVGPHPAFLTEWLPGQILSGIGVGATLPVLASAALAAVPGGRYATASAVLSSTRQVGGVLGVSALVVIIGSPTAANAERLLRQGWLFCAGCFAVAATGALFLGPVHATSAEQEQADAGPGATVQPPLRAAESAAGGDRGFWAGAALLARLPQQARDHLAASAEPLRVAAGQNLFAEGDWADELYLVVRGRLEVAVGDSTVRELGAGSAVGELALLTGGTRSATVRVRRDSDLLRVSRSVFEAVMSQHPGAALALAQTLAEQLSDSGSSAAAAQASPPSLVAVVGLHSSAPVEAVAACLVDQLGLSLRVVEVGSFQAIGPDGLERAERDHDRVVLVARAPQPGSPAEDSAYQWREFCLRQADMVVAVGRAGVLVQDTRVADVARSGADLVLVGPRPTTEVLRSWCAAASPWQVTCVQESDLSSGLGALGRRIAGRSVGLVLGGGGARAFAHIGVLQGLAEAGVQVDRVAGASVGAIVAALHARGYDPAQIHDICYVEFVRKRTFSDYTIPTESLARGRRSRAAMRQYLGEELIEALPRQFRCVSTDLGRRSTLVHRSADLVDAVMASVALPVLYPPQRVGDRLLVDGGVLDNLPAGALSERSEVPLVAVNITMGAGHPSLSVQAGAPARPPRIPSLGETLLRTMMIGSSGAVASARRHGAWVVTPPAMGVGLLEFHQLDQMVESGRRSAQALLEQAGGELGTVIVLPQAIAVHDLA